MNYSAIFYFLFYNFSNLKDSIVFEIISLLLSQLFGNDGFNSQNGFNNPIIGSTTTYHPKLQINCLVFFLSFAIDLINGY